MTMMTRTSTDDEEEYSEEGAVESEETETEETEEVSEETTVEE